MDFDNFDPNFPPDLVGVSVDFAKLEDYQHLKENNNFLGEALGGAHMIEPFPNQLTGLTRGRS